MTPPTPTAAPVAAVEAPPPPVMMPASPPGDPQAARRLAAAFRQAADAVERAAATGERAVIGLADQWSGVARDAAVVPIETLGRQARQLVDALAASAVALEAYARRLENAQQHHAMSVAKLVTIGAVVVVTAGAVVVTAGAAAVVLTGAESVVAAGLAGLTEAAAAGAVAEASATSGLLSSSLASMSGVRALAAWALPHLVAAEISAGTAAATDEATSGAISVRGATEAAAFGFVGSVGTGTLLRRVAVMPWWTQASALGKEAGAQLVGAGVGAGTSAGQQLIDTGRVDAGATVRDTAVSTGVSAGRSAGAHWPSNWPKPGSGSGGGGRPVPVAADGEPDG